MRTYSLLAMGVLSLVCGSFGCEGTGDSLRIRVPAEYWTAVNETPSSPLSLNFPADAPFNIHIKNSKQNPGPAGKAQGRSDADGQGQAWAEVEVENGGSAEAEFIIGHRINVQADQSLAAVIDVTYDLAQTIQAPAEPKGETTLSTELFLTVQDERKKQLVRVPLQQSPDGLSAVETHSNDQRRLRLTLETDTRYDIIISCTIEASADQGQQCRTRVAISQLNVQISAEQSAGQPTQ